MLKIHHQGWRSWTSRNKVWKQLKKKTGSAQKNSSIWGPCIIDCWDAICVIWGLVNIIFAWSICSEFTRMDVRLKFKAIKGNWNTDGWTPSRSLAAGRYGSQVVIGALEVPPTRDHQFWSQKQKHVLLGSSKMFLHVLRHLLGCPWIC